MMALISTQRFCLKLPEILALVKIPVNFHHSGNDHNTVPLETASYLKFDWLCLTCTMWDKLVPEAPESLDQDDTLQLFYKQSSPEDHRRTDTILYLCLPAWNITADRWPAIKNIHFPYIFDHLQPPFFSNCLCQPGFSRTWFPLLGLGHTGLVQPLPWLMAAQQKDQDNQCNHRFQLHSSRRRSGRISVPESKHPKVTHDGHGFSVQRQKVVISIPRSVLLPCPGRFQWKAVNLDQNSYWFI